MSEQKPRQGQPPTTHLTGLQSITAAVASLAPAPVKIENSPANSPFEPSVDQLRAGTKSSVELQRQFFQAVKDSVLSTYENYEDPKGEDPDILKLADVRNTAGLARAIAQDKDIKGQNRQNLTEVFQEEEERLTREETAIREQITAVGELINNAPNAFIDMSELDRLHKLQEGIVHQRQELEAEKSKLGFQVHIDALSLPGEWATYDVFAAAVKKFGFGVEIYSGDPNKPITYKPQSADFPTFVIDHKNGNHFELRSIKHGEWEYPKESLGLGETNGDNNCAYNAIVQGLAALIVLHKQLIEQAQAVAPVSNTVAATPVVVPRVSGNNIEPRAAAPANGSSTYIINQLNRAPILSSATAPQSQELDEDDDPSENAELARAIQLSISLNQPQVPSAQTQIRSAATISSAAPRPTSAPAEPIDADLELARNASLRTAASENNQRSLNTKIETLRTNILDLKASPDLDDLTDPEVNMVFERELAEIEDLSDQQLEENRNPFGPIRM